MRLAPAPARTLAAVAVTLGVGLGLLAPATAVAPPAGSAAALGSAASAASAASVPGAPAQPLERKKRCKQGRKFRPTSLAIPGLTKRRAVLALGRGAGNVPKAPPLTEAGKRQFAWDAKDAIKAGSRRGVVKLNAHTYPDGSAMGNTLINGLYAGDRLVLRGAAGERRCYEVIDRVQITAETRYKRYYRTQGRPGRVGIAVCSGVRRGPGDWSHRTIWFAKLIR